MSFRAYVGVFISGRCRWLDELRQRLATTEPLFYFCVVQSQIEFENMEPPILQCDRLVQENDQKL